MPRRAASGTKGLDKAHHCGAKKGADPLKCDCEWRGRFKGRTVVFSKWAINGHEIKPREKKPAQDALVRFKAAVNAGTFDPSGERPAPKGGKLTLGAFVGTFQENEKGHSVITPGEWFTRRVLDNELSQRGLLSMLRVIVTGRLGGYTLVDLGDQVKEIEDWLSETGKARSWKKVTWNHYHELLNRICKQAVAWQRMRVNPMAAIARRKGVVQPEHFRKRYLTEDVEDKLFAVVDQLNVARPRSTRGKLTFKDAQAIRAMLAKAPALERGSSWVRGKDGVARRSTSGTVAIAKKFGVSAAVVSSIKHGDIWKDREPAHTTTGTEMRRRLIGAFDGGLRAGEMQRVKLEHVDWRPIRLAKGHAYRLVLPPDVTKGGKTTGENEVVIIGTTRGVAMLEARRFQLKNNPANRQFMFGAEDGSYVASFEESAKKLFKLAGLKWSRAEGVVWHQTRHEFASRVAENTKDPNVTKRATRHKSLRTVELYMHTRDEEHVAAAAGLQR